MSSQTAQGTQEAVTDRLWLLLVEDNPGDAVLVRHMLGEGPMQGVYELVHVELLGDAVAHLVVDPAPSCVLLDLGLPDAQGLESLVTLRALRPDLPILVLTGRNEEAIGIQALRQGAQDYLVKGHVDADSLARSIRFAMERVHIEAQMKHVVVHDDLTGLANRAMFMDRLAVALGRVEASTEDAVAVMVLDLDRFKEINTSRGHDAGDLVLRTVAARLQTVIGSSDSVFRLGGDEFGVVCNAASPPEAAAVARRVLSELAEPIVVDGSADVFVTASIGIAMARGECDAARLLRDAEVAKYRAQLSGGNRVEINDEQMLEAAKRRVIMSSDLRRALRRNEFVVLYQPIIDLRSGRISGAEALVRWAEPRRGLLDATELIAAAEDTGLIVPLGTWVLRTALHQAAAWHREFRTRPPLLIAVNLSVRQLLEPNFIEVVVGALADAAMDSGVHVQLEITESMILSDYPMALRTLGQLKELGVQLAIDDFGTGFASFTYVKELPIDVLKVDRTFISRLGERQQETAIVKSVLSMSNSLGLVVSAEGVETGVQLRTLHELGCHYAQGFYFAPPLPVKSIAALLHRDPRW